MSRRPNPIVPPDTPVPGRGLLLAGYVLLGGLFALQLYRLGVFHFPFIMDDYVYAYWTRFRAPVPEWAWGDPLRPYLRPIPYYGLWPLVLSVGEGAAAASRLLAFVLITAAAGFQLAFWRRLGAGTGESLALVACFYLAAWQVALVGWTTGLSDTLAVLGVSAALYFAASGGIFAALLFWVLAMLSKQTALVATPVIVLLVLQGARARRAPLRARNPMLIGSIVVGLAFGIWSVITWFLATQNLEAVQTQVGIASEGVLRRMLSPLLSLLNLADLPVSYSTARVDPLVPAGIVVLVATIAIIARGRARTEAVRSRRPVLLAWSLLAVAIVLGALLIRYPWSSYMIAPVWPVLVIPVLLARVRYRGVLVALILCTHAFGASIQALPVARNDAQVNTLASHHSAGRLMALAALVRPVEEAAAGIPKGNAREYFVKGLPKHSWIGFQAGISGALWADEPDVRAYSVSQWFDGPDLSVSNGYIIYSGTQFGSKTTAIAYADYKEILDRLDSLVALPPAQASSALRQLETHPPWGSLMTWVRDRKLAEAALRAREADLEATADTLMQTGWALYAQTQCGLAVAADFIESGILSEARVILDGLVRNDRDNGETHFLLAVVHSRQHRLAPARESLERARLLGITPELEPQASRLDRYLARHGYPPPAE